MFRVWSVLFALVVASGCTSENLPEPPTPVGSLFDFAQADEETLEGLLWAAWYGGRLSPGVLFALGNSWDATGTCPAHTVEGDDIVLTSDGCEVDGYRFQGTARSVGPLPAPGQVNYHFLFDDYLVEFPSGRTVRMTGTFRRTGGQPEELLSSILEDVNELAVEHEQRMTCVGEIGAMECDFEGTAVVPGQGTFGVAGRSTAPYADEGLVVLRGRQTLVFDLDEQGCASVRIGEQRREACL